MSTSENISSWKKKAEIDYIPLFIFLWFSLNAWMRDHYNESKDREMLELLKGKGGRNKLFDRFAELINEKGSNGSRFRGNLGELYRALEDAKIPYDKWPEKFISFECCIIDWNNGQPKFGLVSRTKFQHNKIQIDDDLWFENDIERLFAAYIEIVYQIRCTLFHGNLAPKKENERVIRELYLTLLLIMEKV